jgi:hypothetical protein
LIHLAALLVGVSIIVIILGIVYMVDNHPEKLVMIIAILSLLGFSYLIGIRIVG